MSDGKDTMKLAFDGPTRRLMFIRIQEVKTGPTEFRLEDYQGRTIDLQFHNPTATQQQWETWVLQHVANELETV